MSARRWPRTIGARIFGLFLVLLLAVQLAGFGALRASLQAHAHRVLPTRLIEGERLLLSLLDRQAQTLTDAARLLAADYGFRAAVSSGDAETIASALENHGARIGAADAALLTADFRLRSTTTHRTPDLWPLIAQLAPEARSAGQASGIALLAERPYQAVLVPVKSPLLVGWVLMAFPLENRLAADLRALSGLELTLLVRHADASAWRPALSGLGSAAAARLAAQRWDDAARADPMHAVPVEGEELGVRARALGADARILALVTLSVDEAGRVSRELQAALLAITGLGIVLFAFGSVIAIRRVTTPLRRLVAAAERLRAGDYTTPVATGTRADEIGDLAQAFERMRASVAENQAQIVSLAYWDGLTGLPNRARFRETVAQAIANAAAGARLAVLMLDLNRFKQVNDVLGLRVGDQLLIAVAQRLTQQLVRDGDLVARLDGDEFCILLFDADAADALAVAERIERAFDAPLVLDGQHVDMGAAMGIACWPQHAGDGDTLLARAEIAMVAAKRRQQGALTYEPGFDSASAQSLTLVTELRQAIERNELRLHLQPRLTLRDARLAGAEALLRWQHPQRGMVPPGQFIPFAERTGVIRALTLWVFEAAVRARASLAARGLDVPLSVNLSTRDLLDQDLPHKLGELLARHHSAAKGLCLEITESAVMDDPQRSQATLERLAAMGFRIAIDDYGTGYSSLTYLKRLPVGELKIDQSFVRQMRSDAADAAIVRSTIDLAHHLGVEVVAEGVEDETTWEALRAFNCDQAQGYHMGRPMPWDELPAWAQRWSAQRAVRPIRPRVKRPRKEAA